MTVHLRPYQEQALAAEAQHRIDHPEETRLAIVMATGLGKTIVMAAKAAHFMSDELYRVQSAGCGELPRKVLILVHTDELAHQAERKVSLVASKWRVGVVKAERDETDADIIIGSVQTLADPKRRQRITDVGLVIVDECHHATAASYQAIMEHFGCMPDCDHRAMGRDLDSPGGHCTDCYDTGFTGPPTPALGFTATLERGDGQGLGEVWHNVCFTRDISWGVRRGYLVQPVGHRLEIDVTNPAESWPTGKSTPFLESLSGQDAQLVEALAPEKIVEKWIEIAKDRPTVAFMPLVRSAQVLVDAFQDAGIHAAVIHGELAAPLRRMRLDAYERGDIQVLVNAMVLTEGWDSPRTKCVIVGRPTKSRSLFVQMTGRGLRPVPGIPVEDQDCILLCVADSTTDLCSVADLSDRPLPRTAQGALTAMEDQWDIGKALDEEAQARLWAGRVDAREFDPLVQRSSKVWRTTKHGTPFLPISKDGEYVFIVGTSVFVREHVKTTWNSGDRGMLIKRIHKDLPDLELAMSVAEDEAQERGGDLGRLLADRNRAWRKAVPEPKVIEYAERLGLGKEVQVIMAARAGGKAGKVSDLISERLATLALEPMVEKIKERTS